MRGILVLVCLGLIFHVSAQEVIESDIDILSERQVWAFYLSFWAGESTWEWNETVLTDTPIIGRYNSKMPQTAAIHIAQTQNAGITAFVVSWFGLDENVTTTPALINLLHRAEELDFKIAAGVDVFNPAFNRDANAMLESLLWLREEMMSSSAYLRYQGMPVIVFAFQDETSWPDETWRDLRNQVDPEREMLWIAEGLSACCLYGGAMDGMYGFNMAWASGNPDFYLAERDLLLREGGSLYIPSISPGWDEDTIAAIENRPRPTSRRDRDDGAFLMTAWNAALETDSDIVMIVSWNEFMENSHIEPSEVYGWQSLRILQALSHEWSGRPITPFLIPNLVYYLQVDDLTPAFVAPDRNAEVVAILQPGIPYDFVGEDNGLYAVLVDGDEVYAPFESVRFVRG